MCACACDGWIGRVDLSGMLEDDDDDML